MFCVTSLGSLFLVSSGLVPMCFYFCLFCFVNFIVKNHSCEFNNLLIPVSLRKSLNIFSSFSYKNCTQLEFTKLPTAVCLCLPGEPASKGRNPVFGELLFYLLIVFPKEYCTKILVLSSGRFSFHGQILENQCPFLRDS